MITAEPYKFKMFQLKLMSQNNTNVSHRNYTNVLKMSIILKIQPLTLVEQLLKN